MTKEEHEQAVNDIAKALKQVVSVHPQLLYEASVKCYSDLVIDAMATELEPNVTADKIFRNRLKASICLWLGRVLIQGGHAKLTQSDLDSVATYAQFISRSGK